MPFGGRTRPHRSNRSNSPCDLACSFRTLRERVDSAIRFHRLVFVGIVTAPIRAAPSSHVLDGKVAPRFVPPLRVPNRLGEGAIKAIDLVLAVTDRSSLDI